MALEKSAVAANDNLRLQNEVCMMDVVRHSQKKANLLVKHE